MTPSGVPTSPGFPLLDPTAQQAIHAARSRMDTLTGQRPVIPPKGLSEQEKQDALKDAAETACLFCAALHPGASTPACPRLATFKLNGDGAVIEGSFWPDTAGDVTTEAIGEDGKTKTVHVTRGGWDTSKVVFAADIAEQEKEGEMGNDA